MTEVVPQVESDAKDPSGYPRLPKADWGESPRVFPRAHHVHIHDTSPEWYSRASSSLRDWASRPFFPSHYYHERHA